MIFKTTSTIFFSLAQFSCSVVSDPLWTPWITACQASLSITNSQSSSKPMSIESVMPSNHLILCIPLLLLPSIFPSIRIFSNELFLHIRWPKYWSFSFSISPSNKYSRLISFRLDWLDLSIYRETGGISLYIYRETSQVALLVKNPPAMQETPVWVLGREDLLDKG